MPGRTASLPEAAVGVGLYTLKKLGNPADPQDMTRNDEPIYETVKREHNWDPERREPLGSISPGVGRHRG